MMMKKTETTEVEAATEVITGQMTSAPPPKANSSTGLRPTLSEIQPSSGWIAMKQIRVSALSSVAWSRLKPAVLVRNFCM